jgi:hypothetical protein
LKVVFNFFLLIWLASAQAQFHPPAGVPGSSAIHKDSAAWMNWASSCQLVRGYQDVSSPLLGITTVGDSSSACGVAGNSGVVSLGDGGFAILQFPYPIRNGAGYDFAVFENSFSDDYLELAFVEVSSDGVNYFRFPSVSNTQDTLQVGTFGLLDATRINNLAGKYRMNYGTPFDLQDLYGINDLDINHITHIKIIDVVGSVTDSLASFDSQGQKINDPWPTPFASSGFDLDAVGVLHQQDETGVNANLFCSTFFVIQVEKNLQIHLRNQEYFPVAAMIYSITGNSMVRHEFSTDDLRLTTVSLSVNSFPRGIYVVQLVFENGSQSTQRVVITSDNE